MFGKLHASYSHIGSIILYYAHRTYNKYCRTFHILEVNAMQNYTFSEKSNLTSFHIFYTL